MAKKVEVSDLKEKRFYRSIAGGEYYIVSWDSLIHFYFRGLVGEFVGPPEAFASVMKEEIRNIPWW